MPFDQQTLTKRNTSDRKRNRRMYISKGEREKKKVKQKPYCIYIYIGILSYLFFFLNFRQSFSESFPFFSYDKEKKAYRSFKQLFKYEKKKISIYPFLLRPISLMRCVSWKVAFTRWTISITVSQSFNRSNKRWTISCRQFGKQHFSKEKKRKKKREIKNTERERERGAGRKIQHSTIFTHGQDQARD